MYGITRSSRNIYILTQSRISKWCIPTTEVQIGKIRRPRQIVTMQGERGSLLELLRYRGRRMRTRRPTPAAGGGGGGGGGTGGTSEAAASTAAAMATTALAVGGGGGGGGGGALEEEEEEGVMGENGIGEHIAEDEDEEATLQFEDRFASPSPDRSTSAGAGGLSERRGGNSKSSSSSSSTLDGVGATAAAGGEEEDEVVVLRDEETEASDLVRKNNRNAKKPI